MGKQKSKSFIVLSNPRCHMAGSVKTHTRPHLHRNWDRYWQGDETGFNGMGALVGDWFDSFPGVRVANNCFWQI